MSSKPTCIKSGSTANLQFEAELYAHDPRNVLFLGFKPHSGVAGNQDVWYKITNLKYELKKEKPVYTTMATGFQEVTNSGYRYGFQGQERDNEWKGAGNSINYNFRMYDPRLGRFFAVDPLSYKYPYYSPYHFAGNTPIRYLELEGLESGTNQRSFSFEERLSMFSKIDMVFVYNPHWTGVNGDSNTTVRYVNGDSDPVTVVEGNPNGPVLTITRSGDGTTWSRWVKTRSKEAYAGVGYAAVKSRGTSEAVFVPGTSAESSPESGQSQSKLERYVQYHVKARQEFQKTAPKGESGLTVITIGRGENESDVVRMGRALAVRRKLIDSGLDPNTIQWQFTDGDFEVQIRSYNMSDKASKEAYDDTIDLNYGTQGNANASGGTAN